MSMHRISTGSAALILALAGSALAQESGMVAMHTDKDLRETTRQGQLSPKLHNLGKHSRKTSTTNPQAQKYFDQGLVLSYAFNHAEAVRSFKEVQRLDPECAMSYWGEAYALGPNINAPMDESAVSPAWEAIQKAIAKKPGATETERAMIDALATRYSPDPKADRAALDKAYAAAMQALAKRSPTDADILSIAAESVMDTDPWNYWTNDGNPRPYTRDVIALIEKAIALNADHPLALHLHIHALEASQEADRAVTSGERLLNVAPGAGHLVHMPSHIFFRVGRYNEAAAANLKAIAVDEDYITQCKAQGIYPAAYYPHNVHFLWIAYSHEGRSADAITAAKKTASKPHPDMAAGLQQFIVAPYHAMVRFAKWDEALAAPRPADNLPFVLATWHWARGMALANTRKIDEAESELANLKSVAARPDFPQTLILVNSPPPRLMQLAERLLAGEIALVRRDTDDAISHFSAAVRLEDSTTYNEPPDWPTATRHWLADSLLDAKRPVEAEAVFLEDLRRRPNNGWALFGLVQAIKAQGTGREADLAQAESRWKTAWPTADVKLHSAKW